METYDSRSRQWSRGAPTSGRILASAYDWQGRDHHFRRVRRFTPFASAYDHADGQLEKLGVTISFAPME